MRARRDEKFKFSYFENSFAKASNLILSSQFNRYSPNRNGAATGNPNTNEDCNIDENLEKMKADQNYDECNFRDRASRNPSVSGLLDNKAQGEPPLQLNKQIGSAEESQNSVSDDKMKKDTENNNSQGDNVISNDKVKVNDAAKLKSSTTGSGKLVPKKCAGILDLGMLEFSKEEVVKEEIIIPWGIIRYSNKWRMRWEILIMFIATYNGFSVPYLISFILVYLRMGSNKYFLLTYDL